MSRPQPPPPPSEPSPHELLTAAARHHSEGRLDAAAALYREVLARWPDYPDAHHNLGVLLMQSGGALEQALPHFRAAWEIDPTHPQHGLTYLQALVRSGRIPEAERLHADGTARGFRWPPPRALAAPVPPAQPLDGPGWKAQGLRAMGEGRAEEALRALAHAARAMPADAEPLFHMGQLLAQAQRFPQAEAVLRQAVALRPQWALARTRLAGVLQHERRHGEAERLLREALATEASLGEARSQLGLALLMQGRVAEAKACYREHVAREPGDLAARSTLLFALNYAADEPPEAMLAEARAYGELAAARAAPFTGWHADAGGGRLRVGLVSGDLGEHPVGYLLENVLPALRDEGVDCIAYPTLIESDALAARLRSALAGWKPIAGLSDAEAARRIHDDGLHVLLDLSGHTANNRLPVFAWRPAPLQGSWIGYFATTGVAAIDFIFADEAGVPAAERAWFTERVAWLPDTRLCFAPPAEAPPVAPLPALSRDYVTFASFQPAAKITAATLGAWALVMAALPTSRLRLQNGAWDEAVSRDAMGARLAASGIAPQRVEFHGQAGRTEYLRAYAEVDVVLDTLPYPGGITTCEALWMGVPTASIAGRSLIARQGASLLGAAGLGDWVAADRDDLVARVTRLAADVEGLARLRASLRERVARSALMDAPRFAGNVAGKLRELWTELGRPRLG